MSDLTQYLDYALIGMLLAVGFAIVRLRNLFAVVMLMGVYSLLCAAWFVSLDAVDVAFTEAAVGARHPEVEACDLSGYGSGADRLGLVRRVPVGPVLAITPFNFPLNLVAHKLAPAVAAGCPVVLKPASQTPSPALALARILDEANADRVEDWIQQAADAGGRLLAGGERDGREVIDLTLTPLPEAAVVWGKVTVSVLKEGWIPPSIDYYDEDMDLARTMTYSDVRDLGGRRIPAKMEMRPTDTPGEHTEIVYHDIEFDIYPSDDIFTLRSLPR